MTSPIKAKCPVCKAPPGELCHRVEDPGRYNNAVMKSHFHPTRQAAAWEDSLKLEREKVTNAYIDMVRELTYENEELKTVLRGLIRLKDMNEKSEHYDHEDLLYEKMIWIEARELTKSDSSS